MKSATFGAGLILILVCAVCGTAQAANKLDPAAVALVKKALAVSNIEANGSPAFQLQATADVINGRKKIAGTLTEFWTPGKKERIEILFHGYNYLEVSVDHHSWTKTNDPYMPYPVSQLLQYIDFAGQLQSLLPRL